MKKQLFLVILMLSLVAPIFTATAKAASNDYTTWKQYDSVWNQAEAWPKSAYPNASLTKMSQAGCVVTSIAMLLRHYNVVRESNVNNFNPWILNEQLKANGGFTKAADLIWDSVKNVYPAFKYAGSTTYSLEKLTSLYNQGYACLVKVGGSGGYYHFVAVRSISGSTVTIMDPGSTKTSLNGYGNKYQIIYYSTSGNQPTGDSAQGNSVLATISGANMPAFLWPGQAYSIKGVISSDTVITSVTAGVYDSSGANLITGRTVSPNSTSYNLKNIDPYVYFNRLENGSYFYIVKATNSAGEKVLVSQKFEVGTVSSWVTLSPKCAPQARVDVDNAGTGDGVNIQIHGENGTPAQDVRLVYLGNGYYAIQFRVSGRVLDVEGGNAKSRTNIQQWGWNTTYAQQWKLVDMGDGYFAICSRLDLNLCLDTYGGYSADRTNVWLYTRNNSSAQCWKINFK